MSNQENNIALLKECNALLEGHFVLSSGLHSKYYVQCAKIMASPKYSQDFCAKLVEKLKNIIDINTIDKVVAPAMGGVIVGYEIARQLGKENVFCERVDGSFALRRGFELAEGDKVLVVEDVLTTGKSSLETYKCIKEYGAEIIAETCLIRRNPEITELDGVPIIPLLDLSFPTYKEENLPEDIANIPVQKPGSRFLKK